MKISPPTVAAFVAILYPVHAEQIPALLTSPQDGTEFIEPEVRAVFKPADVIETTVTQQGGREIIVQHLALDPNDPVKPAIAAQPAEIATGYEPAGDIDTPPAFLPMLSATVFPGPRTFLSWLHQFPDGTSRQCSGWSNIDFNHYAGTYTVRATDNTERSFALGIGTMKEPSPDAPDFATVSPTFIPDQKDIPAEALITVDSLHKLYAIESEKLAAAHAGRERARLAKEAELLANPPQPKDLIIRYRIAETPLPTPAKGGAQ